MDEKEDDDILTINEKEYDYIDDILKTLLFILLIPASFGLVYMFAIKKKHRPKGDTFLHKIFYKLDYFDK